MFSSILGTPETWMEASDTVIKLKNKFNEKRRKKKLKKKHKWISELNRMNTEDFATEEFSNFLEKVKLPNNAKLKHRKIHRIATANDPDSDSNYNFGEQKIPQLNYTAELKKFDSCIKNPLVAILPIGKYNKNCFMKNTIIDLDLVTDLNNIFECFATRYGYDILVQTKDNEPVICNCKENELIDPNLCKMFFNENDVLKVLDYVAEIFNGKKYDGLIFITSCHGFEGNIYTSRAKLMQNVAMQQRITNQLSADKRNLPKIFIWDCCQGTNSFYTQKKVIVSNNRDISKKYDYNHIWNQNPSREWSIDNPIHSTYNCLSIYAASFGQEAKFNINKGSYLIYYLTDYLNDRFDHKQQDYLLDLVFLVLEILHIGGKSLPYVSISGWPITQCYLNV